MTDTQRFDVVVIGAGGVGDPLSRDLAKAGRRTLLVERGQPGGTCTNTGCTPTKTLIASAHVAHLTQTARQWGIEIDAMRVNLSAVQKRKASVVAGFREDTRRALEETPGLQQLSGEAHFVGPGQMAVRTSSGNETTVQAETVIINTGTRPAPPPVEGIESVPYLYSSDLLELQEVPKHLLVLGGNYIGLELAQGFRRFGSQVTVVEAGPHVLPSEDEDIAKAVTEVLSSEGVVLHVGCKAVRVQGSAGDITLELENGTMVRGTHLLAATGRIPNTEALNLSAAGVEVDDQGFIKTNTRLQTSAPHIWAAGDVAGSPQFSHIAYDDYRVLKSQLLGDGSYTTENRLVPYVVYTDPPLGRIGLSEQEAQTQNRPYKVAARSMTEAAYAIENNSTQGMLKILIDSDTDQLMGAACFGLQGDALSTVVHTAMLGGVTARQLADATFAHPTLAETLSDLLREK